MFENLRKRHARRAGEDLTHADARLLRDIGLNPDDFRDAFEGRRTSVLFRPFRQPGQN